jgi:hypothetical protein
MLTPGVPVELTVELWSTALVFNAGHRIRISVSGSNWPRFEVNPNDGLDLNFQTPGQVARLRLLFGGDRPSRLELPVLPMVRRAGGRLRPVGEKARFAPSSWTENLGAEGELSRSIREALIGAMRRPNDLSPTTAQQTRRPPDR